MMPSLGCVRGLVVIMNLIILEQVVAYISAFRLFYMQRVISFGDLHILTISKSSNVPNALTIFTDKKHVVQGVGYGVREIARQTGRSPSTISVIVKCKNYESAGGS